MPTKYKAVNGIQTSQWQIIYKYINYVNIFKSWDHRHVHLTCKYILNYFEKKHSLLRTKLRYFFALFVDHILKTKLTVHHGFHSHLEPLTIVTDIQNQVSIHILLKSHLHWYFRFADTAKTRSACMLDQSTQNV